MFLDSGDLRICNAKSELKKQLQSVISVRLIEKEMTCSILDGSAILYVVHWPDNGVLNEYIIINFKDYVSKLLKRADVYLVLTGTNLTVQRVSPDH